jgi:hypothetical protein
MLHEPPGMSADDFQWYLREPLRVDPNGDVVAPSGPGLGVEPDPAKLADTDSDYVVVTGPKIGRLWLAGVAVGYLAVHTRRVTRCRASGAWAFPRGSTIYLRPAGGRMLDGEVTYSYLVNRTGLADSPWRSTPVLEDADGGRPGLDAANPPARQAPVAHSLWR